MKTTSDVFITYYIKIYEVYKTVFWLPWAPEIFTIRANRKNA